MNAYERTLASLLLAGALFACPGCQAADCGPETSQVYLVTTNAQLEALVPCVTLSGRVEISGEEGIDGDAIELPNLESVEQGLFIHDLDTVLTISLPALRQTGADGRFGGTLMVSDNGSLRTLSAPRYTFAGAETQTRSEHGLQLFNNPALATVELDALRQVGGEIVLDNNGLLPEVVFPSLVFIGDGVRVTRGGTGALSIPALTEGGGRLEVTDNLFLVELIAPGAQFDPVIIQENPALETVDLRAAISGGVLDVQDNGLGTLRIDAMTELGVLRLVGNQDLQVLSAPALTSVTEGNMEITDNASLDALDVPMLSEVRGGALIERNPLLPDCEVRRVLDQVGRAAQGLPTTNLGDGC